MVALVHILNHASHVLFSRVVVLKAMLKDLRPRGGVNFVCQFLAVHN